MIREELPQISLDIDRDRLREIVAEALRMMHEYLQEDFGYTDVQILQKLDEVIESGKVSTMFYLPIGSKKIPDLVLRVDPRRRDLLCKSAFKKKVAKLNHLITTL